MEIIQFMLVVLLAFTNFLHGFATTVTKDEKLTAKQRLSLLNKPAVKSFQIKHGDMFDCVEINKQLAFDHPLLKNHSIQMRPSKKIMSKHTTIHGRSSSGIILPKINCPRGTVPIKRIQEEELIAMENFTPSMALNHPISTSKFAHQLDNQTSITDHIATVVAFTYNHGVQGQINTWNPEVKNYYQFSSASVFVASDDGSVTNAIQAGWSVYPYLYKNYTRLTTFWTKDSAQSTGCFNILCPGFVQTSQKIPLGLTLNPVSQYNGQQLYINVIIIQDVSANWWLMFQGEPVGYWPQVLFSTMQKGATRVGWGGEVGSPSYAGVGTPAMGSGHFPDEGFRKACFINQMNFVNAQHAWVPASKDYLRQHLTDPSRYNITFDRPTGIDFVDGWGHFMFFGGPPKREL